MKMSIKKNMVFAAASLLFIAIAGLTVFYLLQEPEPPTKGEVSYAPPTAEDSSYNNAIKQDLSDKDDSTTIPNTNNNDQLKLVSPNISAWGQPSGPGTDFVINGYIPHIIEKGGECTVSLTKDGVNKTATKTALQNAQDTTCGQLRIPFSSLSPGSWVATISYRSSTSEGISQPVNIEVK